MTRQQQRGRVAARGRARIRVVDAADGRLIVETVHPNTETGYALDSLASWLVGGAGVVAPAPPSYLALGLGATNMLTEAQADIETTPTGWQAASNCAVAQSSSAAWHGSSSLAVTASSTGTMTATTTPGTSGAAVTAGNLYSASVHFLAAATGRAVSVNVAWYDSNGNLLSTSTGATVNDSTGGWTRAGLVAAAPAGAAYAAVQAQIASAASSEVHYLDGAQLAYAPDSAPYAWSQGGQTLTPATTDTQLAQERYGCRAEIDSGYTQSEIAVLLHTYQQTDPAGSFFEAGLFDANTAAATLAAQASPGASTLTLAASAPAVTAGQQIYIAAAPLLSPSVSSFTGASTTGGYLVGGATYYYKLTAVGANGETLPGGEASYAVPAGTNTNQITLNWAAVAGASGYKIYRAAVSNGELLLATVGAVTSYADNTNTTPSGSPPTADGSGVGEYATVAAAAAAGATSWTLTDTLLYTHPDTAASGTTTVPATVTVFSGNLWAHAKLTNVSKAGTQLLTLQWEIQLSAA